MKHPEQIRVISTPDIETNLLLEAIDRGNGLPAPLSPKQSGKNVRLLRAWLSISRAEFAKLFRIGQPTLQLWEDGVEPMPLYAWILLQAIVRSPHEMIVWLSGGRKLVCVKETAGGVPKPSLGSEVGALARTRTTLISSLKFGGQWYTAGSVIEIKRKTAARLVALGAAKLTRDPLPIGNDMKSTKPKNKSQIKER